jgi:hypothetical protein
VLKSAELFTPAATPVPALLGWAVALLASGLVALDRFPFDAIFESWRRLVLPR